MKQLSPAQRDLVLSLVHQLGAIPGMVAVVLGGSHARGCAKPDSDIDLGLLYSETAPFSVETIRQLSASVNDTPGPVVTDFYDWGPWVNGGAWLTVAGHRVDFIYRSLEHVERVIAEAENGRYEIDYAQQPPFGFFSGTYLGEVDVCIPLFDPEARVEAMKRRVAIYPATLRCALIQDFLWQTEFGLAAFARKFAARGNTYGTTACLTRAVNQLVLVLFALNREYPINDKTVLADVAGFARAPCAFGCRVQTTLAEMGSSAAELAHAVDSIVELHRETVALAAGLYQPRFNLLE